MKLVPGQLKIKALKLLTVILLLAMTTFAYGKKAHLFEVKRVFFNSFEAKVNKNSVELTWVVTEYNNKNFQVQHSINGTDWDDIALVASKNSPESLEGYSFKHFNTATGKHYYRIKHTDVDLKQSGYSEVRIVTIEDEKNIIAWPNPATDRLSIMNNGRGINLYSKARIFDLSGRMMIEKKLEQGVNTIIIAGLSSGTYFLYVENGDGNTSSQKIIKQ